MHNTGNYDLIPFCQWGKFRPVPLSGTTEGCGKEWANSRSPRKKRLRIHSSQHSWMRACFINSTGGSASSLQHTEEGNFMVLTQGGRQCWLMSCREDVTAHVSPEWGQELCQGGFHWWLPLNQQREGLAAWMLCLAEERPWTRRKGLAAMVTTKPLLDLHYPVKVGWKDRMWISGWFRGDLHTPLCKRLSSLPWMWQCPWQRFLVVKHKVPKTVCSPWLNWWTGAFQKYVDNKEWASYDYISI